MKARVAIYPSKTIRGQVIAKTLSVCGIQTEAADDPESAVALLERGDVRLIILDVNNTFAGKIPALQSIAGRFPEFVLVIHSNPKDFPHLAEMGLRDDQCLGGPLDPEAVLLNTQTLLKAIKAKYGYFKFPKNRGLLASWRRRRRIAAANKQLARFNLAVYGKSRAGFPHNKYLPALPFGLRFAINFFLIPMILLIGIAGGYTYWTIFSMPDIDLMNSFSPYKSSKLYSYDNVLLTELYVQRRTPVPLSRVPGHVQKAFIAIEDARYFDHIGIDPIRILGALYADIKAGEYKQGASTITQQLAKMIFLKPEKTIARKIREIAIALQLERTLTKDQILELYLNQAYFGSRAYGIEAAAEAYFGKGVHHLTIAEGAMLAALPKAPSVYSPFQNPEKCRNRRTHVLQRMLAGGVIDNAQFHQAAEEPLPDTYHGRVSKAPYFVDYCIGRLTERFGDQLFTGGLQIYSTLDYTLQKIAEDAVKNGVAELAARGAANIQAALVAIEIKSGRIRAIVGGTDYEKSQFNRATQA